MGVCTVGKFLRAHVKIQSVPSYVYQVPQAVCVRPAWNFQEYNDFFVRRTLINRKEYLCKSLISKL